MFSETKTKTSSLAAAVHTQLHNGETAEPCHRALLTVHSSNTRRQGKGRKGQDGERHQQKNRKEGGTTRKTQTLKSVENCQAGKEVMKLEQLEEK